MPKRIPIKVAKDVSTATGCRQVILLAWDGDLTHVVTYGTTLVDCEQAAVGGNRLKDLLGWPENTKAEPSRVVKLQERIRELEARLAAKEGLV